MSDARPTETGDIAQATGSLAGSPSLILVVGVEAESAAVQGDFLRRQVQSLCQAGTLFDGADFGLRFWGGRIDALAAPAVAQAWTTIRQNGGQSTRVTVHRGIPSPVLSGRDDPLVERACRILAATPPGTVLLGGAAAAAMRDALPPGVQLYPLGSHRLSDLLPKEPLFAVLGEHQEREVPVPRTLEGRPHNLPVQSAACLGRWAEKQKIVSCLAQQETRLLTLIGPGGTGKTRLALEVAAAQTAAYRDGVWFVDLAPLRDPDRLMDSIATVLDIHETGGHQLVQTVAETLRDRHLLLIMDNFEQVTTAAPVLAHLLRTCPGLRILATSREPLRLAGEVLVPVDPLVLPNRGASSAAQLLHSPAAVLFWQRAQLARPDLALTDDVAPLIAEICTRLDALPLALELAAARCQTHTLQELSAAMANRLQTLRGGARTRDARQQTLQGLIDWSYTMLSPGEQALFARLSVFSGGWTAEAATAVCVIDDDLPLSAPAGLDALLSRSLLRTIEGSEHGGPRFTMLETIGDYAHHALERLWGHDVAGRTREQHLRFYLDLAEKAAPALIGSEQLQWLARLEEEHDNLRAALRWSLEPAADVAEGAGGTHVDLCLRLAGALWRFWYVRGHLSEGRAWLARAIEGAQGSEAAPPASLGTVLTGAGVLALSQGDYYAAREHCGRALSICRQRDDIQGVAMAVSILGNVALLEGELDHAVALSEESLQLQREIGSTRGITVALNNLGTVLFSRGEVARAESLYTESLALNRELGDRKGIATALFNIAEITLVRGDCDQAAAAAEESLAFTRALGDTRGCAAALMLLGQISYELGAMGQADRQYQQSLELWEALGDQAGIAHLQVLRAHVARVAGEHQQAWSLFVESLAVLAVQGNPAALSSGLVGVAALDLAQGHVERAARLCGAAAAVRGTAGLPPSYTVVYEEVLASARAILGAAALEAATQAGSMVTLERLLAEIGTAAG